MKLSDITVLDDREIQMIDEASRKILTDIGILVPNDKVLMQLSEKGADVDFDSKIVKVSNKIINDCLDRAPEIIKIYYRDRERYIEIGKGKKTYVASGHNAIYYFDEEKGEKRPITKKEVGNFALISDYLDEIDVVGIQAMPQDVNSKSTILHALDAVLNNTIKPVYFSPENGQEVRGLLDIIKAVCGEVDISQKPIGICQLSPSSPLTWSNGTVEGLAILAEEQFPFMVLSEPMSGVTAPKTLAGLMTVTNAEDLSGVIFAQLINPGTPVIYGSAWTTFEMTKGTALIGIPERYVCNIAHTQLAKYYHLPSHSTAFDTDANLHDEQNAIEKLFNTIATMMAKTDIVIDCGMFSTGLNVSYEQLVVDNDMAKFVRRFLDGIVVNEETIAYEVIKKVGQNEHYLMEDHTIKHIKPEERTDYQIFNRVFPEIWEQKSKPSIMDNAGKLADKIIAEHKVKQLNKSVRENIRKIIQTFEDALIKES
ncbi:MAG: trimethylamine methyltransferase family protein [Candidatus Sifarchaeia archaeon]